MQLTLDSFEQEIEDNAERFVPITGAKRQEIEAILAAAAHSAASLRVKSPLSKESGTQRLRA